MTPVWDGSWVAAELGVDLVTEHGVDGRSLPDLVGLAVRRNPKRAHLLVSTVLGKHIPTDPRTVLAASSLLGATVASVLGDHAAGAVVFGYAETATALGHGVADALGAWYLHSTRRDVAGVPDALRFEEAHSHATTHLVRPGDASWLRGAGALVLVDDELSTGRTALATIAALQEQFPRQRYVVAALVDLRGDTDRDAFAKAAADLGVHLDVVALATGRVALPADVLERGVALADRIAPPATVDGPLGELVRVEVDWPRELADGGRHGITAPDTGRLTAAATRVAHQLSVGGDVVVLGTEELMYAPLRVAAALADREPDARVRFSATTRSPVLPLDRPGYAIKRALTFPAHDTDDAAARFVYNLDADGRPTDVVLVVDEVGDTPALHAAGGLLDQVRRVTDRVHLVVLPFHVPLPEPLHGPTFGSYAADEVSWLLTDLSGVDLEAPTEEREEAVQSGGAHYAESLPIEYQPSAAYQRLYERALADSAARLAVAVGVVTELVLAERGRGVVLASLARAGTPIGVLMRRWAARVHGLDVPHRAVSIVRGRGLDQTAMRWLAAHHDSADVVWVDGWTGKGAISRELDAAVAESNAQHGTAFSSDLAVLADPGSCVRTFGTRDDFLIPSACLNSTVSGLVSRTVLNRDLLAPHQFHGAKFYADLAPVDVSNAFVDAVSDRFDEVRATVAAEVERAATADRTPTWAGWRAVEQIAETYGIHDVNLVKPGVGETTRVLLRRVPWKILVRPDAAADTAHVRLLADERGVPVEEVDGLAYSCVGLIHPRFTRGATGADGTAAS
ncbi:phosphoribosyltransferase [Jatrophihabitans sp. YIM 134969]